jgi:hypothetical protein
MRQASVVFIIFGLSVLTFKAAGQNDDPGLGSMANMYEKNSPLDFLQILKTDFIRKGQLNIFSMTSSPENWVKEEHIPELMKLIYSPDSTNSIVHVLSSYLPIGKYSSIGREAQNLINSFRTDGRYPPLWSFGSPDKEEGKEIEEWWKKYSATKP